jgi:hypothetical protein
MEAQGLGVGMQLDGAEVDAMLKLLNDDGDTKSMVRMAASAGLADAWSAALFDRNNEYELWIVICTFAWLTLHRLAKRIARWYGAPLEGRPTFIANNIHCITTSLCALYLLCQSPETRDYSLWQRWVLPFSISYFIADFCWYCIPQGDLLITMHHFVMILCHYPVNLSRILHYSIS